MVRVVSYRELLGEDEIGHREWADTLTRELREIEAIEGMSVRVFNMGDKPVERPSSSVPQNDIDIYINGVPSGVEARVKNVGIQFQQVSGEFPLAVYEGERKGDIVKDDNGNVIAEVVDDAVYFYAQIFKENCDIVTTNLAKVAIEKITRILISRREGRSSWKFNRERLIENVIDSLVDSNKRRIEELIQKRDYLSRNLSDLRQRIVSYARERENNEREISMLKEKESDDKEKYIKEIDMIAEHPRVERVHIEDGYLVVFTEDIYTYDSLDRKYYLGKMKIKMSLNRADVRFYNTNNAREAYWSENDPHPHVNGASGEPCLGNMESPIAELSSQGEIYALFTVCMNFLESANLDDIAGKSIKAWDIVGEEGEIIQKESYNEQVCDDCEEQVDELLQVHYSHDRGQLDEGGRVCQYCADENYYYSENVDALLHYDFYEVVCDECAVPISKDETEEVYTNVEGDGAYSGDTIQVCGACIHAGDFTYDHDENVYATDVAYEERQEIIGG